MKTLTYMCAHGSIVLTNWSDGHNHIYLYKYDEGRTDTTTATLDRQLTKGDFEVGQVYRVDSDRKEIYYASNESSPLDQQTWQVDFDGERKQLTTGAGHHSAIFTPIGGGFTDKFSSLMEPPVVELCAVGTTCMAFWASHAVDAYGLHAPEQIEVKAHDGTTLYATLLLPKQNADPASCASYRESIRRPGGADGSERVVRRVAV